MTNAVKLKLIDIDTQIVGLSCTVHIIKKNEQKNAIETPEKKYMLIVLEDETTSK
ncbi:hypothetical protein [Escherichia coli]|uniref:hypothetical protein n=1 Tax=Escherichia coli TaxID=562 RepID=UPI0032DA3AD8